MPSPTAARAALTAALLLAASLAAAAGGFDYVRVLEPVQKPAGTWTGTLPPGTGGEELVRLAVVADWWEGPGDPRVNDAAKAAMPGIRYEVRRGEGPWTPLPPADRDLRLEARAAAPEDAKGILGGAPAGPWAVRQAAGGAYPRALRLEFGCRGDPLLVKDLRVKSLALPDLDPKPVIGKEHHPDRVDNPTLRPGAVVKAVVVVANSGARKTKEVDLDLLAVLRGKRQGKRIAFAQVPGLAPGAEKEIVLEGRIPADVATEGGVWEILALVNPRAVEVEVDTWNNGATRAFRLEIPAKTEPLPGDLRDR
jgi:hypothetical protein